MSRSRESRLRVETRWKESAGNDAVLQPVKVAVGQELETVRVVQGSIEQPAAQLIDVEAGLDLLDPGLVLPEDAVHAAFDPEAVAASFELPGDRHLGVHRTGSAFARFFCTRPWISRPSAAARE